MSGECKALREDLAMFGEVFPCNPIPFLKKLAEGCRKEGCDYIKLDEAKRILYVVIALVYGQMAKVDLCEEWERLKRELPIELLGEDEEDNEVDKEDE